MNPLRIGTRGSRLALWQADYVADRLKPIAAPRAVELVEVVTAGDRVRDLPLNQIGGEGLFTKEIQRALLAGEIDVAVHSLKDLPTVTPAGLLLAAVPLRGPVGDVLIAPRWGSFDRLPRSASVATGSLRRAAQARHRRPDLQIVPMRGNVETRLRLREERNVDALILAEAGLDRLGLAQAITERLDPAWMLPAVGQGALGLECRCDDGPTRGLVAQLDHLPTHQAVAAEREMLHTLGGGCQVPVGVFSTLRNATLTLCAAVLAADGSRRIEARAEGPAADAGSLGRQLAAQLLGRGAAQLLVAK